MAERVKVRMRVAMAGPTISLAAGDEYEVDPAVAEAMIADGRAEAIEPPAERRTVTRAGAKVETASIEPDEKRGDADA